MEYTRMTPRITYKRRTVSLPDGVDPKGFKLGLGERLVDEEGVTVACGPSMDGLLSAVQDTLDDAKDMLQDGRELFETQ